MSVSARSQTYPTSVKSCRHWPLDVHDLPVWLARSCELRLGTPKFNRHNTTIILINHNNRLQIERNCSTCAPHYNYYRTLQENSNFSQQLVCLFGQTCLCSWIKKPGLLAKGFYFESWSPFRKVLPTVAPEEPPGDQRFRLGVFWVVWQIRLLYSLMVTFARTAGWDKALGHIYMIALVTYTV